LASSTLSDLIFGSYDDLIFKLLMTKRGSVFQFYHWRKPSMVRGKILLAMFESHSEKKTMCATPKGASRERIQAEFTSLMTHKYGEHDRIYMDGLLMDDKVGFAFVTNNRTIKKRMRPQSSIYSAEQQAIITALENGHFHGFT
jgi:hypothetical protein